MRVLSPREFVEEYNIRSLVACFSGGKDSLVMTHYVMSELQDVNIDKYVVFVNTGVMIPTAQPYVEDVCRRFGWNLKVLKGDFFTKAERYGMPTMFRRWCCWECKLKPISEFTKTLKPQRAEAVGLRRDESLRRRNLKQIYYFKRGRVWKYAPILYWTEKDVLEYIRRHDLPMPPHYSLGIRETCQCGAFSSRKQMMIVKANFPELFQKFVELEGKFRSGGAAFYFDDKPCYAREMKKQKTLQEFDRDELRKG